MYAIILHQCRVTGHPFKEERHQRHPVLRGQINEHLLEPLGVTRTIVGRDTHAQQQHIGARRLQTVMERVLDDISFNAPDKGGETLTIDAEFVDRNVGDLAKNTDLSRFIL